VGRLLHETDPRLTYTAAAVAEGAGLDALPLPFSTPGNPDAGWNSNEILGKLTQVDESAATFTDQVRCGANSVLAVAVNRGPRDTIAWARAIMRKAYATADDRSRTDESRRASRSLGDKVWESIARMERTTATYGDLSNIAHHAKVILSNSPTGATTGHEVAGSPCTSSRARPSSDVSDLGGPRPRRRGLHARCSRALEYTVRMNVQSEEQACGLDSR